MAVSMAPVMSRRVLIGSILLALGSVAWHEAAAQQTGQFTFLILGTDKRSPEEPENSDVIMVSRVDLDAATVRTLSIPRDLYVEIPGQGWDKINAAFNNAVKADPGQRWDVGAAATQETIAHNFGLDFDGIAMTDMKAFPQIVDAVGGVTVDNPSAVSLGDRDFPVGTIELDGAAALAYCRARYQDGDGGRVMRQHLVLKAMLAKLQNPAMLANAPDLIASLKDAVRTNIPTETQLRLLSLLPTLSADSVTFTNIDRLLWADTSPAGAWIYQGDWSTLPGYVQSWLAGEVD